MSILIKEMQMPKNCIECRFAVDGWCYAKEPTEPNSKSLATHTRPSWCPLIELPPHGRLIDGDVAEVIPFTVDDEKGDFTDGILYAADWISKMPTIIESEE